MAKGKSERKLMPGVKPGLISAEHQEKMGNTIWQYLDFLMIPMVDGDDGILQTPQGDPYTKRELIIREQRIFGLSRASAYRRFKRLEEGGYLFQREDGRWEITKYQNFRMFFAQKKEARKKAKCLKNETECLKNETECLKNETESLKNETTLGSKRVHKNKNKKGVTPSEKKEEITTLQRRGMAMLRERCKSRGDTLGKGVTSYDAKNLKEMLESGYTLEEIFACYDAKLDRKDLKGKHVPMEWVKRDIAYFVAAGGPTTEEELEAIPDLMEDEDE